MFHGYSPETVDFLWGIRLNNNREWFMANKANYVKYLYEPTKAFGAAVFEPFLDRPGDLLKVSRIYRDARMHHPVPYKESLWICIRRDVEWWAENPCLFLEICPEGVSYGLIWWHPRPGMMEDFRKAIAAKPREFLKLMEQTEKSTGVPVAAETYKRTKGAPTPALEPYYDWKGKIACVVDEPVSEDIFGPELGQRAADFLEKLIPLYEYFNKFQV